MDTSPLTTERGHLMVFPPAWNREAPDPAMDPSWCRVGRHTAPAEEVHKAPCGGTICDTCDNDAHLNTCRRCSRAARADEVWACPTCGWLSRTDRGLAKHVAQQHVPAQRAPEPEGHATSCAECGVRCPDNLAPPYECDTYGEGMLCLPCHSAHTAGCSDCRYAEYHYADDDREVAY